MPALEKTDIAWKDVESYQSKNMIEYILREIDTDQAGAERLFHELKKFLYICHKYHQKDPEKKFAPSKIVDEAWHCFVLFTPEYSCFCRKVLQRPFIIGHVPTIGQWASRNGTALYQDTLEHLKMEFGSYDPEYWPTPERNGAVKSCSSCHGCNGGSGDCTAPN